MIAAAAVAVLAAVGLAGWLALQPAAGSASTASPTLTWTAAQAPLPSDAVGGSAQAVLLSDVACPGVGSCVGVGYSYDSQIDKPLIETLSNGAWTASDHAAGAGVSQLNGIACPAQGSCVAVGEDNTPVVATLSDGTWTAAGLPLPGDAAGSKNAELLDVDCPAAGTCIATGVYLERNGDDEALIETLSGGSWTAMPAPLPAGAVPAKPATQELTLLASAACPAVGSCVTVGHYTEHGGAVAAFTDTLSGGTWTPATAPLPADAAAAAGSGAGLSGISCRAPGNCVAVGSYTSRGGQLRNLAETLSGGVWTAATPPLAAGTAATQKGSAQQGGGLATVACWAAGSCVALGYTVGDRTTYYGAIDTLSRETWTAATAPLPPGAATTKQDVVLESAVCPAPGDCVAVGGYEAQDGSTPALIETAAGKHG